MCRDLQRLCHENELKFQKPSQFPRNGLLAARIACAFDTAHGLANSFVKFLSLILHLILIFQTLAWSVRVLNYWT